MKDRKMTLQEMCEAFEVTPRTLRYYEYIELLAPERQGRKRLYGPKERARLKLILRGRKFGFSLEEIRQWLELYEVGDGGKTQYREWIALSTKQIDELRSRQAELEEAIQELVELRSVAEEALAKEG
ncbi:DNA-binding transcriptional MerR regulator [Rubricella aquisinus]|uniref:DNA-binding transcriptional MerR regulator n=1 Tax=Rubricella aquisinus TaxID=2028108 RepID=A0A840WQZ1_9RHOB|nr:MerR family DNA-binding transcriptional regulator [Rubricella aquisinus]MBB5516092.1 DNA-binding transcriptional MerR regulator [Rubricella aquisinus]